MNLTRKLKRLTKKLSTNIWDYSIAPKWSRIRYFYSGNIKVIYSTIVILGVLFDLENTLKLQGLNLPHSNLFNMPSYTVVYLSSCLALVGSLLFALSCPRLIHVVSTRTDYVKISVLNMFIWNAHEKVDDISKTIGHIQTVFGGGTCEISIVCNSILGRIKHANKKGSDSLPEDIKESIRHLLQIEYDTLNKSNTFFRICIAGLKNIFILVSGLLFIETVYRHIITIL